MINWEKEGKATSVLAFMFTGFPLILGLWMVFTMNIISESPILFTLVLYALFIAQISLLVYSKYPNILSGNYFTFGPSKIIKERRKHYYISYTCLIIGILIIPGLLINFE